MTVSRTLSEAGERLVRMVADAEDLHNALLNASAGLVEKRIYIGILAAPWCHGPSMDVQIDLQEKVIVLLRAATPIANSLAQLDKACDMDADSIVIARLMGELCVACARAQAAIR